MAADERLLETRPARPGLRIAAGVALVIAICATVWAYVEYSTHARASLLALALGAMFFAVAATVLTAFRGTFAFRSLQASRVIPSPSAEPIDLVPASRRFFVALLGGAASSCLAIVLLPLRSLGSRPRDVLQTTAWRRGVRLLTPEGVPLRVSDLPTGSATPVVPATSRDDGNSAATLVRLSDTGEVRVYSRICTHAGCSVCVFRADESLLICPCHHSTYDASAGGRIVSGPASQPLPELPVAVDSEGFLVADGDFDRPIGPLVG